MRSSRERAGDDGRAAAGSDQTATARAGLHRLIGEIGSLATEARADGEADATSRNDDIAAGMPSR